MSADADRIAALEAELAEARGLPRQCAALGHTQKIAGFCAECAPDATPMERLDAAQERASAAQAAEARAKKLVADVRAEWSATKAAHAAEVAAERAAHKRTKADMKAMACWRDCPCEARKMESERDAARAEAAARLELIGDAALFLRSARRHLEGTAVEGTPWFDGLVHLVLVLEEATREPSVLAARVPLLEAVAMAARTLVTWKDNLAFGLNKKRVLDALAALDEKGGGHG